MTRFWDILVLASLIALMLVVAVLIAFAMGVS